MKKLFTFITLNMAAFSAFSQASWSTIGSNFATNSINPKILVYDDTAYVAYVNASGSVELKKNMGANWLTIGTYTTIDNKYDFDISNDGALLLSTVDRSNNPDNTAYEFYLKIRSYENGVITQIENEYIGFGPITTNQIDVFDVDVNPNGGYGLVFRYNNSYPCTYMAKTNSNPWYVTNYTAPGGSSGVKDSKLIYTNNGAVIYSRNASAFGGTVNALVSHAFRHETTSSTPINVAGPSIYGTLIEQNFNLTKNQDTIFLCAELPNFEAVILNQKLNWDGTALQFGSLNTSINFGSTVFSVKMVLGDDYTKYVAYSQEDGMMYPGKIMKYNANFTNPQLLGNENFNNVGNMVGEFDFTYSGDIYVAFQYGPPFNNSRARKYACAAAPTYVYNATTNLIETSTTLTGSPTYQWYDCNAILDCNEIPGATGATFSPSTSGIYGVGITNGDCSSSSNFVTVTLASINELKIGDINVFPNPANTLFTIDNIEVGAQITVTNAIGQTIKTEISTKNQMVINAQAMQNGVYFISIHQNGVNVGTKKIIITH
jgi:hypothetical protein